MTDYLIGTDFSEYQPPDSMDYGAMKAGGVAYACARTGDGSHIDPAYAAHRAGWLNAGVPCDAYHYVRSGESAITWAQRFHALAGATAGNVIWLDAEDGSDGAGSGFRQWMQDAVDELRRLGRRPGIYTRASWWMPRLGSWWPSGVPLWISGYPRGYVPIRLADAVASAVTSAGVDSVGATEWAGWQFTSSGVVPGWDAGVDLSIATPAALAALYPNDFGSLPGGATKGILMALTDEEQRELLAGVRALHPRGIIPRADAVDPAKWALNLPAEGPAVAEMWAWMARIGTALGDRTPSGLARRGDVGRVIETPVDLSALSDDQLVGEVLRRLAA